MNKYIWNKLTQYIGNSLGFDARDLALNSSGPLTNSVIMDKTT